MSYQKKTIEEIGTQLGMAIARDAVEAAVEQFNFCTDSESGTITARDFTLARMALKDMLPDAAIANGAWGWIDDQDGNRYWIAEKNSR